MMKKILNLIYISALSFTTTAQIETFTSSGVFTVPAGVTLVTVEVIGAGGQGGINGAGGGGGGGYAKGDFAVSPGTTHSVVVGLATSGLGTSSVASVGISATKGGNGISLTSPQIIGGGGAGGFGIGGQINRTGGNGGGGYWTYFGGGGGGAAGSISNGGIGGNTIAWTGICLTPGGSGGTNGGAPAGNGGKGAGFTDASCNVTNPSASGASYGAGGGGANGNGGSFSVGANGFVQFTWCGTATISIPTGAAIQSFCNPATVADLVAQGNGVQWYSSNTGGSPLANTLTLINNTYYYAEQISGQCEIAVRLEVLVNTENPIGAPSGNALQSFCNAATVADLVAQGTGIQWYSSASGGAPLSNTVALINNTNYYAEQISVPCETVIRFEVLANLVTINSVTALAGTTITASQTGATYAWLNCTTNQIIPNATGQSYTPTVTGDYAVIITIGSCSDTSSCVSVDFVGLDNLNSDSDLKIFPNPATEILTIQSSILLKESSYVIQDQNGKIVKSGNIEVGETTLNIKELSNGVYLLKIGEKETQTFRVLKN